MSILEAATSTAGAATTSHATNKRNKLKVNGKYFTRLDCIGRGGSSRVYRVMAENSKFFALKKVNLEDADEMAVRGFKGEIDLLKKLETVERVIRLYDYELNEDKGTLTVVS
jgi:serine/threonine-protein kinase TTK/MPS1